MKRENTVSTHLKRFLWIYNIILSLDAWNKCRFQEVHEFCHFDPKMNLKRLYRNKNSALVKHLVSRSTDTHRIFFACFDRIRMAKCVN